MYIRLNLYLEFQNCHYPFQFGFCLTFLTNNALISTVKKCKLNLTVVNLQPVFLQTIKKAFYTVNHNILAQKREYYVARGIPKDWFASYLNNRKQYVSTESYSSKIRKITAGGVPKTSILGPILFLKYVIDLNKCMKHPKVYHFADDKNIPQFNASIIDLA